MLFRTHTESQGYAIAFAPPGLGWEWVLSAVSSLSFSMANLKIELSKLDGEAWPGALDIEKEKLMLINEKEELLKELQFVTPQRRTQDELERLEAERQRLEEELAAVRGLPSRALAERFVFFWVQGDMDMWLYLTGHRAPGLGL